MSFLTSSKSNLGDAIMKGNLASVSSSTPFDTTQNELWTGAVTAVASQTVQLGIRVYAPYKEAQQLYGLPQVPGDFIIFDQAWVTTQTNTAAALMAQINASTDVITTTGAPNGVTTIYLKDLVTGASTGSGAFTITADQPYVVIEVAYLVNATCSLTLHGYNMATDPRNVIIVGTPQGGNISVSETGQAATTADPIVPTNQPFDVIGKTNCLNARVIDNGGTATVGYQIYVG